MFVYLFQVMLIFSILFLVYQVVFRKFTFHALNRYVLVLLLPISLVLPLLIYILPPITEHPIEEIPQLFEHITTITTPTSVAIHTTTTENSTSINYIAIGSVLYLIGVGICLLRFSLSIYRLYRIKKQSVLIKKDTYHVYESPVSDVFSYFHWIFVPKGKEYDTLVIMHEKAHIQLRHTIDLFLTEVYIIFFWWNPLIYLFRKSLKSIHEYQADQYVLASDVKTSDYLQLIAQSLTITKPNHLYSYFQTPILKKRIQMMTKNTSHYRLKLTYLLILPVCALVVVAFTKPTTNSTLLNDVIEMTSYPTIQLATPTLPSITNPTFAFPIDGVSKQQITAFFDAKIKDPKTKKLKVHTGIDIRAELGTPIIATADGTVFLSKEVGAWGNLLKIKHDDGYETWYAHLKDFNAHYGQSVKKGDVIGYVGMTGNSTGPHLHYELRLHKKSINPLDYLEK
ncbi:M23/M56 family metallopeptidase [uncultured Dokdonia sp.]|uniref:M23/M56 family metallopeptidase n=1 Tax=uncultured Dokdonia sp. TaxID=575653 RepID=UPI0026131E32|nr:M23/M56 family metallopeptidase [uncultured Dokdonia sp.]